MRRFVLLLIPAACLLLNVAKTPADSNSTTVAIAPTDWPWWRGPNLNGIADSNQSPPTKWSVEENLHWKAAIPGRGHSSPIVFGDSVYLATAEAEPQIQSVLCLDRKTGQQRWKTPVHEGGLELEGLKAHPKSSLASSTIACDGERLFINFFNNGAVYTSALDLDGKLLWQKKISDYIMHQGFGSSPAIYDSLVIVSADNKGGGAIAALDRATGEVVWKNSRPPLPNYTSPIILNVAGREQLVFSGCDLISSFEPLTGNKLWEIPGSTTECVTSIVTDGKRVFVSGGYPKNHVAAIEADGSGKIAWEKNSRVYVPSMLVRDGHLYAVLDAGVATCWNSATGEDVWTHRLGGNFTASPVLVGDNIYATSETGQTVIFKASPKKFELVGENNIGGEVLATPTISHSDIFIRAGHEQNGTRQETLYCFGRDS